jgi:hypothetical protein
VGGGRGGVRARKFSAAGRSRLSVRYTRAEVGNEVGCSRHNRARMRGELAPRRGYGGGRRWRRRRRKGRGPRGPAGGSHSHYTRSVGPLPHFRQAIINSDCGPDRCAIRTTRYARAYKDSGPGARCRFVRAPPRKSV